MFYFFKRETVSLWETFLVNGVMFLFYSRHKKTIEILTSIIPNEDTRKIYNEEIVF